MSARAQAVIDGCLAIATFSETPDAITRTYLAPPTRQVHDLLHSWMDRLGLDSWVDAAGNLRGLHRGRKTEAPRLLIGSHIDTVPNSGAFDGVLGVVMALSLVEALDGHELD
jgi:allantoate deiminase